MAMGKTPTVLGWIFGNSKKKPFSCRLFPIFFLFNVNTSPEIDIYIQLRCVRTYTTFDQLLTFINRKCASPSYRWWVIRLSTITRRSIISIKRNTRTFSPSLISTSSSFRWILLGDGRFFQSSLQFFQPTRQKKNLLRPWWNFTTRLSSSHFLLPSSINLALHTIDKVLRVTYIIYIIWVCVCRVYTVYYLTCVSRTLRLYQYNWRHLLLSFSSVVFYFLMRSDFSFFTFFFLFYSVSRGHCTFQYWPLPITGCFLSHLYVPTPCGVKYISMSCIDGRDEQRKTQLFSLYIVSVLSCWFYLELNFLFFTFVYGQIAT